MNLFNDQDVYNYVHQFNIVGQGEDVMKRKDVYRELRDKGLSYSKIADLTGVSRQAVWVSLNRKMTGGRNQRFLKRLEIGKPLNIINYPQLKYTLNNCAKKIGIKITITEWGHLLIIRRTE